MADPFAPADPEQEIRNILQALHATPERWEQYKDLDVPIVELPEPAYKPAAFLKKTASARLYKDLEELLAELRALNRQYAGESLLDSVLAVSFDEWARFLTQAFTNWGEAYLASRQLKHNARDHSVRHRFLRFGKEVREIFAPLQFHQNTLNCFILKRAFQRLMFRVYNLTLEPFVHPERLLAMPLDGSTEEKLKPEYFPLDPIPGWEVSEVKRLALFNDVSHAPWFVDTLKLAFQSLEKVIPPLPEARLPRSFLQSRLAQMAADLQAIRPFLNTQWVQYPLKLRTAGGASLSWHWNLIGIGAFQITLEPGQRLSNWVDSPRSPDRDEPRTSEYIVDFDGLPLESPTGCRSFDHFPPQQQEDFLHLHLLTMELLLRHLCALWDLIYAKGGALRARHRVADPEAELGCLASQVAEGCSEAQETGLLGARVTSLRFKRLCTVLQKMGVEVRQGKGSEIVLCRGTRLFTLGHHTRNPVISPYLLRSILKKLELRHEELAQHCGAA